MADRARTIYTQQKRNAKGRSIEFDFTYEEWCLWWKKHLGDDWMKKRGCRKGQYVMARYYDDGPYSAYNVKCILAEHNHLERNKRLWMSRFKHEDEPNWYLRPIE